MGYFIGQWPGPSHTYFWRDVQALRRLGAQVDFVSTRLPTTALAPHAWTAEAVRQTVYLFPLGLRDLAGAILRLLAAGPTGWLACARSIIAADGVTWLGRARLVALVLMGAHLAQLARQRQWRHVHVGFCEDAANVALFARLLDDLPYSLTLHSDLALFGPNQRQKWAHAAFGTAVAPHLLEQLHNGLREALPRRMVVSAMGVDVERFTRRSEYRAWRGEGPARLFCSARVTPTKGQVELVRALKLLRDRGCQVRVRLAGEDMGADKWYSNEVRRTAAEMGLGDAVELLGPIPEDAVREELEKAHLFVLPSWTEGLSIAAAEAMAMELPVVVTDVGGMRALVTDGDVGAIVPPRDPQALADAIHRVLSDPAAAVEMGRRGRQKVVRDFSAERNARVMLSLINGAEPAPHAFTGEPAHAATAST